MDSQTQSSDFRRHSTEELVSGRPSADLRGASRLPVIVVLDNVRSAYNVGLIFRLCDCVNITELWLCGITAFPGVSTHSDNHMGKTGVGGSLEVLPWRHMEDPTSEVARLKSEGWSVVALEQGAGSVHWKSLEYDSPTVLVFGHERVGVRDSLLDLADHVAELPVRGITNSMNVAMCASAVLYDVLSRWEEGGLKGK